MRFSEQVKSLFESGKTPHHRRFTTDLFFGLGLLIGLILVWWELRVAGSVVLFVLVCLHFVILRARTRRREKDIVWYRAVLDSPRYSIIGTNTEGLITLFNSGAEKMLGYDRTEMVGLRTPECIHLESEIAQRAKVLSSKLGRVINPGFEVFSTIAQQKVLEEIDWTYVRKDQSRLSVRLVISGIYNQTGELWGFMAIAQDITHLNEALSALRESEERFRGAFEYSGIGMALVGLDGKWIRVNQAICNIVGYSKEELLGKTFQDITHPDDIDSSLTFLSELLGGKRDGYNTEKRYIRENGTTVWVHLTVSLVRDAENKPLYFITQIADINALKRSQAALQRSEEIKRIFVDHAPVAVAMFDRGMRYIEASGHWYEDYEITDVSIIGRSHYEVFPHISDEWKAIHEECMTGVSTSSNSDGFIRTDGSKQWLRWEICPWMDVDGQIGGIIMLTQDMTRQHLLENELKSARDQALKASLMKSDFLASMSHEIRTPMNGIMGMNALLAQTLETDDQREMNRVIQNSAENLMTIINDILDFSKIEAGKMRIEETAIDLKLIIEDCLAILGPRAHETGIELINEYARGLNRYFWGDGSRIQQILINLVGNAIKFTEKGGEVRVSVSSNEEKIGYQLIKIEVIDNGIGIAEAHQKRLFEPFTQAENGTTKRYGGTGLGLSICSQLVELMGGRIGLTSKLGVGSEFWFQLLLRKRSGVGETKSELPKGLRILFVDDNVHNQKILGAQLERFRIDAVGVSGVKETMRSLVDAYKREEPFHAVLLDHQMPVVGGVELAGMIRADPRFAHLVLILLSSAMMIDDGESMKLAKFNAQLTKPIREQQLNAVLLKCLGDREKKILSEKVIPPKESLRKSHILVAEDNRVNQLVATRLLNYLGCNVDIAPNGEVALEMAAKKTYDAILMDCQMPLMDGYETTRSVRKGVKGIDPLIRIIALTAYAMESDRLKCIEAGMDDYISKPIREEHLREVLLRNRIHLELPGTEA